MNHSSHGDGHPPSPHVPHYLQWLRPRAAASTHESRGIVLHAADRDLPHGLDESTDLEVGEMLHGTGWSQWTVRTYDTHMRAYYAWALRCGRLPHNPMAELPRPQKGSDAPDPLTDRELSIALTARPMPWRRAMMLACYAGLRACEIASVTVADILAGERLRVFGKGGKTRVVPLAPVLLEELRPTIEAADASDWRRASPKSPPRLCVGAQGRPLKANVLTAMQAEVWRRMGIPDVHLHRGRHWFATQLIEAGVDVVTVQKLLGHSSLATTQVYVQVTDKRRTAAVLALPVVKAGAGLGTN